MEMAYLIMLTHVHTRHLNQGVILIYRDALIQMGTR